MPLSLPMPSHQLPVQQNIHMSDMIWGVQMQADLSCTHAKWITFLSSPRGTGDAQQPKEGQHANEQVLNWLTSYLTVL